MVNEIKIDEQKKVNLFLAALNPYVQTNTVSSEEKEISGKDFISWGGDNKYPTFLWDCYSNCATLQSIINGCADYVAGEDVTSSIPNFSVTVNKKGETFFDVVGKLAMDYFVYGAYAIQVIRSMNGNINEIYWVDVSKLRSDKKNEVFFYSDDWSKTYGRVKYNKYPKFNHNDKNIATSIYYYKGKSRTIYGTPIWNAATKNVQIDREITNFHLNEINNNFLSSKLISFNNGTPDDNLKTEIEKNLNEKFSGSSNAARLMISFSDSKENAPEVLDLSSDDFDARYIELEKRNTEQIYIAFRATPLLFGLVTEANGFSTSEYKDSYKLFYHNVIRPVQNAIVNSFDKIFGVKGSIVITPSQIDFEDTNNDSETVN